MFTLEVDGQSYSLEDQRRVTMRAKRKLGSEATGIASAGSASLFVFFSLLAPTIVLPVAEMLKISVAGTALTMSFGTGVLLAILHHRFWRPKISEARALDAAFKEAYRKKRDEERFGKVAQVEAP